MTQTDDERWLAELAGRSVSVLPDHANKEARVVRQALQVRDEMIKVKMVWPSIADLESILFKLGKEQIKGKAR